MSQRYYVLGFNPNLAANKFKNPPVFSKKKAKKIRHVVASKPVMYKMTAGPLKETTNERDVRLFKERQARYNAKQEEKARLEAQKKAAFDAKVEQMRQQVIAEENMRQVRKGKKRDAKLKTEYEKAQRKAERKAMRKEYHEANRLKLNASLRARYLEKNGGVYVRSEETRKKMSESLTAKWAERKAKLDTSYASQECWAVESLKQRLSQGKRDKKRNSAEACARAAEKARLRAEAKKNKSVVITITITDLNKS
jgi:hypothetical protein